jgi:hypothetical protein
MMPLSKSMGIIIVILSSIAGCKRAGSTTVTHPCDLSDRIHKSQLDAAYPIGTPRSIVHKSRGRPHGSYDRGIIPPGDTLLLDCVSRGEAKTGDLVDRMDIYYVTAQGFGYCREIVLFNKAGEVLYSYRLRLG